ncbi:MAG: beta-L-arabinofuranosidase domain-containing protein [Isosphaeraceae bacterium]
MRHIVHVGSEFRQRCAALACLAILSVGPALPAATPVRDAVQPTVPLKALPFELEQVRLLPGPFRHAMELDQKYLLALDPDRLLHTFRLNAGLPSSARPLGGWEAGNIEVRGHFTGHYMSACALMYASTGDERFKTRGEKIVAGLAECQRKLGSGYLSAFPETFIDRVERQERVWAPWYTLHKILAGLLEMNQHCQSELALDVAREFADWVKTRTDRLSDKQMQAMLGNEHGGMNEALANLYARTGEAKYLKLAERFNHDAVLGPAAQRRDTLTGLHANTQIPKFIGTAREYELSGKRSLQTASLFFWNTVVKERSYVIGGHSDGEMFSPKETLSRALGPNTTETCNTYNMLKLTRHLFEWGPRAEYADYYERALYNHILSSQNPQTGMMCYYVPLRSGSRKVYNSLDHDFWCCTGTGIENHAKYGDSIYFHDGDKTLYVNLFIASELSWIDKGVALRQETGFPDGQSTRLVFTCKEPTELVLKVRHPSWAASGFVLKVNGEVVPTKSQPGSYEDVSRSWRTGDAVELSLPFGLHTEGFRDNPERRAFLYGPLVLAAEVDPRQPIPAIVADAAGAVASLQAVAGRPSTFQGSAAVFRRPGDSTGASVTLEPFYKVHGNRHYVVYWDFYTSARWQAKEAEYATEVARRRDLASRTVDWVNPGDEQNERAHQFRGENTRTGRFSDRGWRDAAEGWFRYVVQVRPDWAQELCVTYWGSDSGGRVFDILVDDTKLATERLERNRPEQFYDQAYRLPPELIKGKSKVTVTFKAHPGRMAGGIFGLRVLTPKR